MEQLGIRENEEEEVRTLSRNAKFKCIYLIYKGLVLQPECVLFGQDQMDGQTKIRLEFICIKYDFHL